MVRSCQSRHKRASRLGPVRGVPGARGLGPGGGHFRGPWIVFSVLSPPPPRSAAISTHHKQPWKTVDGLQNETRRAPTSSDSSRCGPGCEPRARGRAGAGGGAAAGGCPDQGARPPPPPGEGSRRKGSESLAAPVRPQSGAALRPTARAAGADRRLGGGPPGALNPRTTTPGERAAERRQRTPWAAAAARAARSASG